MTKIIYVSFVHLSDRISRDWHIDYLIANGATVEYWDIVPLVRVDYKDAGTRSPAHVHVFHRWADVEAMVGLPENRDTCYVMLISYGGPFTRVFRILSKHNCRMVFVAQAALPGITKSLSQKVVNHLSHPVRLFRLLYSRAKVYTCRRLRLIKPFDIVFAAGELMVETERYARKVVPINLCDYDHYMRVKSAKGRLVTDRYAVFLDTNLAYHSDLELWKLPAVTPASYCRSLNRFFDLTEREYRVRVVIAAHPTATYNTETFEGREIVRLRTAEAVRDAEFVISQHSTSLSYAVLNAKPVIFIYTTEMLSLYRETIMGDIYAQAESLGAPTYNIDEIADGSDVVIHHVDHERYENYKYRFVTTHESEDATTEEIFWREMKAIVS